jgi:outer membrane protein OmpA-like peptidoglycan-associated protein
MLKSKMLGLIILSVWFLSWGCDHKTYYETDASDRFYTPQKIPIKPGMIRPPDFNVTKTVTLINAQMNADWALLGAFTHPWRGNLRMWTDTAVGLATNELKKRGVSVTDELPLILRLTITPDEQASALTGFVARQCPLDTDRDGVPDYLDKCPGTPQDVAVDSLGCPMDTDRDSLPDYRDHCPTLPQGFRIDNMRFGEEGCCMIEDVPKHMSGPREIYMVSSRPANTVMDLFKSELERKGIDADRDDWNMLRFCAPVSEWTDKFKSIQTALEKEDIHLTARMPRILQLAITDASLNWKTREIGCALNLRVVSGDGDVLDFRGTNYAIDLHDSCDGAVTKQVAAMFNNVRIRNYLAAATEPKDSDCDGVPDEIDECPGTPLGVAVDARGCPLDSDGDGVPDSVDECPGTPKGVKVDSRGCPLDTDADGVPDYLDKCPGTPKGARVDSEGCWTIDETFFDFDKRDITPRFYPIFDDIAAVLNNNPSLRIVIEGHTDNIGTEAYNQKLSEERAKAVKRYLVTKGIESDRLSTVGYGFSRPRASNEAPAGRALNRRVKLEPLPVFAK